MKVIKRSPIIYNEILYVLLSLVFLHVCYSLDAETTALSMEGFLQLVKTLPVIFIVGFLCVISLMFVWKFSIFAISILSLMIFYKTFSLFLIEFDKKILLILNFLYLVFSYNMILLLWEELKIAIYNPGFSDSCVDVENYKNINVEVTKGEVIHNGVITNIDDTGVVVKFKENIKYTGNVKIKINKWNETFVADGTVVTKADNMVGLRMSKNDHDEFGWNEFYNIFYKRGYIC